MFKKLKLLISAAAFVAVGVVGQANAELSDILSAGTIKIAIPENFPPFGSLGAEGEYEGYDVDVAKLIAEDLGVELEFIESKAKAWKDARDVKDYATSDIIRDELLEFGIKLYL